MGARVGHHRHLCFNKSISVDWKTPNFFTRLRAVSPTRVQLPAPDLPSRPQFSTPLTSAGSLCAQNRFCPVPVASFLRGGRCATLDGNGACGFRFAVVASR